MKTEINSLTRQFQNMLQGHPWFGRSAEELLADVNIKNVYTKPGQSEHTLCDMLWHMVTWATFTLNRMEGNKKKDVATDETPDWRKTGPKGNDWTKGLSAFHQVHQKIITLLRKKEDSWLGQKVEYREYDFKYLLQGLIQHDIYHLGQIIYGNKILG